MSRTIRTISVPSGGKVEELLEDMKKNGKNVSQTVCEILERHSTLYDDNIRLQVENKELLFDYHTIVSAAKEALAKGGEEWELYFPPQHTAEYIGKYGDEGYGLKARVHFRKAEERSPDKVSRLP